VNVLTVDVEDHFHVEAFAEHIRQDQWDLHESRVVRNVARILELFAKHEAKGTFFMLGWVAKKFSRPFKTDRGSRTRDWLP